MRTTHSFETSSRPNRAVYLRDAFGDRAIRDMELALLKACEGMPKHIDNHQCRSYVAKRICARMQDGERTFGGLVSAAMAAIEELRQRGPGL